MIDVLLVEDDIDLASTIVQYLELEDIDCDHASNGVAGLNLASQHHYDAILLDINLPKMNGLSVCENLRKDGIDTPILMLTARDSLDDKVAGFNAGSDDYLVKPFAMQELVVRCKALAKRRSGQVQKLKFADLVLNLENKEASRANEPIKLTPTAWKLLETLLRAYPRVLSRDELEQAVWGEDRPDSNSFKVHLHNLRKAVDGNFAKPLIKTITGYGFTLSENDETLD